MFKLQITNSKSQTKHKSQTPINKNWKFVIFVCFVCNLFFWNLIFAKHSLAQTLGLSIYPPINEIMIVPGKSVTQTFTITNDGNDGNARIYIVPFRTEGEYGDILLDEKNPVASSLMYSSWFDITSPVSGFGEKFYLPRGKSMDVVVKISPSVNAAEKDYYFTLIYELESDTGEGSIYTGPTTSARIGANILISLSKDGNTQKAFDIAEFSAPKVIDSLAKLKFNVRVENLGSYLIKPSGKITIKPTLGREEALDIAPLNILSGSVRNIPCLMGEETVICQSKHKVFIGVYKSTLEISANENPGGQSKTITTIALPFSLIGVFVLVFATYKIIKRPKNGNNSY